MHVRTQIKAHTRTHIYKNTHQDCCEWNGFSLYYSHSHVSAHAHMRIHEREHIKAHTRTHIKAYTKTQGHT